MLTEWIILWIDSALENHCQITETHRHKHFWVCKQKIVVEKNTFQIELWMDTEANFVQLFETTGYYSVYLFCEHTQTHGKCKVRLCKV